MENSQKLQLNTALEAYLNNSVITVIQFQTQ